MSSKNYLSSDYLERRGSEAKGNTFKGDNGSYGSIDTANTLLGQPGLTRNSISAFNFNYVYQYFIEKGTDELTAKSLTLIINDVAKLRKITVQEVLTEVEREYTVKISNPVTRATAIAVVNNEQISEIKIINQGISFYDNDPSINITGDGVGATAILMLNTNGTLTPTITNSGLQYTYANVEIEKVQVIKDESIYIPNHNFKTGDNLTFTPLVSNGTVTSLPFGLEQFSSDGKPKIYYALVDSNHHLKLAYTEKDLRLGINVPISQSQLDGGFIINRSFNFSMGTDSYIYMNSLRPNTKQIMGVKPASTQDSLRQNRLLP